MSKRHFIAFCGAAAVSTVLALAGCATPGPRSATIGQDKLQTLLSARFPYNGNLGPLFALQAQAPELRLMPEQNRIGTLIHLKVTEKLRNASFDGVLDVDYGLRYEPSDMSIRLADVHVNTLSFDGFSDRYKSLLQELAPQLTERLLDGLRLHQLRAKDVEAASGWGYEPGAIDVTPQGLRITLNPKPKG